MDATVHTAPKPATHRQAVIAVAGVMLPIFLASLDNTIVAGALPSIGREFGDFYALPWVITIYLIASTASTPLIGKISDIRGRRSTLIAVLLIFITGALVSALAPNMLVLILGRAIQGMGGGGLVSLSMAVLADVAPPKERARYYGFFSAAYVGAGSAGPVLGGFLSEAFHWSAIFWVSVPLGLIAIVFVSISLRGIPRRERPHRLDILGALLIVVSGVSFMLALNLGGARYSWLSPPVLGLGALAVGVGYVFVKRLLTVPEPLIPLTIVRNRTAMLGIILHASTWSSITGIVLVLPMYLQSVMGFTPTQTGFALIVLMATVNTCAAFGSVVIARSTHYKRLPQIGLALAIGALLVMAYLADSMTLLVFEALLLVIGIGFGPVAPLGVLAMQNAVPSHQIGIGIALANFGRSLMSTVVAAGFGTLVAGAASTAAPHGSGSFAAAFVLAAATMGLGFLALALLEERPLAETHL